MQDREETLRDMAHIMLLATIYPYRDIRIELLPLDSYDNDDRRWQSFVMNLWQRLKDVVWHINK